MRARLQVVVDEAELRAYREAARREELRLSEWVRRRLRRARRDRPAKTAEQKLRAIRVATSYSFPTGDMDRMLAEIGAGRTAE